MFQAVTRWDNLTGFGNVPAFTIRHSVGALKGSGARRPGRLGLCTNCDSRMNALSGNRSKADKLEDVRAEPGTPSVSADNVRFASRILGDISCLPVI